MSNVVQFTTKVKPKPRAASELRAAIARLDRLNAGPLAVTLTDNLAATVRRIAAMHCSSHNAVVRDWMQALPPPRFAEDEVL